MTERNMADGSPTADRSPEAALAAAVAIVARGRSPEEDVAALLDLAISVAHADRGSVFLWDAERGGLAIAASAGFEAGAEQELEAQVAADPAHPIARTAHDQTPILGTPMAGGGSAAGTDATWPLRVAHDGLEEPIGALALGRDGPWSVSELDPTLLAAYADLIAVTVDRTRLVAAVHERGDWQERMAHTDALTGLANTRTVARVLELEVARAARQVSDLSVALFDVDGLAAVNASSGPAAGDDMLREFAAVLTESVRLVDTVGRWGGDEFLIVAPGPAGLTVARRVLDAVASLPTLGGKSLTVSAGVARFPADGTSSEALVEAAKTALSTAKATGPGTLAASGAA